MLAQKPLQPNTCKRLNLLNTNFAQSIAHYQVILRLYGFTEGLLESCSPFAVPMRNDEPFCSDSEPKQLVLAALTVSTILLLFPASDGNGAVIQSPSLA